MNGNPDWEAIECAYRAGVLSVREIAVSNGISHTAINKKAKADGWERDLKAKIKAKADALVSKAVVSKKVSKETLETEKQTIEANAKVIAGIRLSHRADISKSRLLVIKLLDELESQTDNRELYEKLGELMRTHDDKGVDKLNDLYHKVISLSGRSSTMKTLSDSLKTLVALERQAYGMDDETPETIETGDGQRDMNDLVRRVAFILAKATR